MADNPQTLIEFSENLLSDLHRGAITPEEALSACQQYAYLREAVGDQSAKLSQAALTGDSELQSALAEVLGSSTDKLREMPSFHSQQPDGQKEEKEIRDSAFLRATAVNRVRDHAKAELGPYSERRRAFIHDLVSKYSDQIPKANGQTFDAAFDSALVSAAKEATTKKTQERLAEMMAASIEASTGTPLSADQKLNLKAGLVDVMADHEGFVSKTVSVAQSEQKILDAVYEHLDVTRPDVLVDVAINDPSGNTDEALVRGEKLAKAAEMLAARQPNERPTTQGFFSQSNVRGAAKGAQQAAEGLLAMVGEPIREIIIKEKINGTLHDLLTHTQQLTDRLGETFVHTALFTSVTQNMSKSLSEKPVQTQIGGVFDDVFSSIFRGPLDPALTQATQEHIFDYLELSRASANAPQGYGFMPKDFPIWDAFPSERRAVSRSSGVRRGWLPYFSLSPIGNFFGDLFGSGVDGATSFLFNSPNIGYGLSAARRSAGLATPFFEDLPLMLSTVVVAVIIILFILPSPFNISFLNQAAKSAVIINSLIPNTSPEASASACIPKGPGDCQWPLDVSTHACIIEGPGVGTHSKCGLSGIDFVTLDQNKLFGATVHTPYAGKVSYAYYGYPDWSGSPSSNDGGTYGNHVIVDVAGGHLLFAHLRNIPVVQKGDTVAAGAPIGFVDDTGLSYGVHLHYEDYTGACNPHGSDGGDINKFTPFPVPGCTDYQTCKDQIAAEGHSSCL